MKVEGAFAEMKALNEELVFLILQFCREEQLNETVHVLERETAVFFDLNYFETLILSGNWDKVERYISGYGSLKDDKLLSKVHFEVMKQKLLEALDIGNHAKALEIVRTEPNVFASYEEELVKEIAQLKSFDDFREHKLLRNYGDIHSARSSLFKELRKIIQGHPGFQKKLEFPTIEIARLRHLINQSLNWQHLRCQSPEAIPEIETLYEDHMCQPNDQFIESIIEPAYPVYPETTAVSSATDSDGCETELSTDSQEEVRPYHSPESEFIDLPVTIGCVLNEESSPTTMDFHPSDNSILLVGTDDGGVSLWDIALRRRLLSRNFKVWYVGECTSKFKEAFTNNPHVSAKCTRWSSRGDLIGVAFSKQIVQIYTYEADNGMLESLEIDAHDGSVNDISFSKPNDETFAITCGDDKMVKVWNASTGAKRYVFDGHKAAVICACPTVIKGVNLIFSTSETGEMRGWMYDNLKYRVAVDDPCRRRMVCSKDGKRIFSCGINEEAQSCILEWDTESNNVKQTYQGLKKPCPGVVHFDTAKNQILAAGDDHQIKFWDMRNLELISSTDTGESLPVYPYIRFNKDGSLLAVSASDNKIVIMATAYGLEFLTSCQEHHSVVCVRDDDNLLEVACNSISEDNNSHEPLLLDTDPGLHIRWLSSDVKDGKICRMAYSHSGNSILALTWGGTLLVWRWSGSDTNSMDIDGAVGTMPQLWKPENSSSVMLNIHGPPQPDLVVPCFALTKNDAYLIAGSGGELSLLDILAFKRLLTFIPPLPQTTAVAIYPKDNNVIAIGGNDSTILIYDIPFGEIKCKLEGHSRKIIDLAFSTVLDILISSGADSKICVWDTERWEMKASMYLDGLTEARIQFHQDQVHFLVIHDTALAIYEAQKLQCRNQWFIGENCSPISCAAFSCNGNMIYVGFCDATLSIFDASSFQLRSRTRCQFSSVDIHPMAIAVHPKKAYQFALGLSDGTAAIFELSEPNCRSTIPPKESPLMACYDSSESHLPSLNPTLVGPDSSPTDTCKLHIPESQDSQLPSLNPNNL